MDYVFFGHLGSKPSPPPFKDMQYEGCKSYYKGDDDKFRFFEHANPTTLEEKYGFSWEYFIKLLQSQFEEIAEANGDIFELPEIFNFMRKVNLAKQQGRYLTDIIEMAQQYYQEAYKESLERKIQNKGRRGK